MPQESGHSACLTGAFFSREFPSSFGAMGNALKDALAALLEHDWIAPDQVFYARLCLDEAVVNAITHGNHGDARRRVRIEMLDEGDICRIRVRDEGGGFNVTKVADPSNDQFGGRGLCLIKYCMDDVRFNETDRCLEMTMHRKSLCREGHHR
jgi:anti-sigma regulatory factor (Ser/Thr protein kinase)